MQKLDVVAVAIVLRVSAAGNTDRTLDAGEEMSQRRRLLTGLCTPVAKFIRIQNNSGLAIQTQRVQGGDKHQRVVIMVGEQD